MDKCLTTLIVDIYFLVYNPSGMVFAGYMYSTESVDKHVDNWLENITIACHFEGVNELPKKYANTPSNI